MRTAPRSYAHADTTRSPPTPARHDGAPAHGPGHAREQRLPRPQTWLVLSSLQPAGLSAVRWPRRLRHPGDARALCPRLCSAHAGAVGDFPQPGSRRGPDPGRAPRLLDQAPCPAYPELSTLLTNGVSRLQTNQYNSTCWPSCHGHTLPPSWWKACNPARNGGAHDHHGFYHGVVL